MPFDQDAKPGVTHIVGAGLAGLAAAMSLSRTGRRVAIHEAGPVAGGRCRSYWEAALGCRIDNGNHLLMSGNLEALAFLAEAGAADSLMGPDTPRYPFMDLETGERWTLAPGNGLLPLWIFDRQARVPGTRALDYLRGVRLLAAGSQTTIKACLDPGTGSGHLLYRRFWEPLAVAALNTEADTAAAALLRPVLRETFGRGGQYCRPLVPRHGLTESFIDPALAILAARGVGFRSGARLRSLAFGPSRIEALNFSGETLPLGPDDDLILAVPPTAAVDLVPELTVPDAFRPIVNAHFRVDRAVGDASEPSFIGLVGGTAEWVFHHPERISVTVSAAYALAEESAPDLADRIWRDVVRAVGLPPDTPLPAHRIVKEKRATFAQTPAQLARRPGPQTRFQNLVLAGDWTDTGLPATIEGAIRSGNRAAEIFRTRAA